MKPKKYGLIGWKPFYKHLKNTRLLWLAGQKGTGKSLLSVALSYRLLQERRVLKAAFNFPVSFGKSPSMRWCVSTIDEGGLAFDNRISYKDKELSSLLARSTALLRKRGSYMFVPSVNPPDKRLRDGLRLWRVRGTKYLWIYYWELGPEDQQERRAGINYFEGRLFFVNPPAFYGVYDTYFEPEDNVTMAFIRRFFTVQTDIPPDVEKYLRLDYA